jgi:phage terminase small subunit
MDKELTPKQERFVEEYLLDLNATAAYKRAGYRARGRAAENAASRLLGNGGVGARIAAAKAARSGRTEIRADRALLEVSRLGFADVRKLYRPDGTLKAPHEWDDDTAAAVAGVEVFEEYEGRGASRRLVGHTRKVRLWDKNSALDKILRHLGLLGGDGPPAGDTNVIQYVQVNLNARVAAAAAAGDEDRPAIGPAVPGVQLPPWPAEGVEQ